MNYNFYELYYRACEDIRDTQTSMQDRAKRWTNEIVDDIMGRFPWSFATKNGYVAMPANRHVVALPAEMGAVIAVRQKESDVDLDIVSATQFQAEVPDPTQTGSGPNTAIDYGLCSVKEQPQSAISVVSDSAADGMAVTITGESDGWRREEAETLNGITAQTTAITFGRITSVVAATAPAGTVTIRDDAGNTLGTIAAGETTATITAQPSSLLRVVSSSAADVTSSASDTTKQIRIAGFDGSGIYLEEVIILNGTTAVSSSNRYNRVELANKSAATAGIVTISSNAGVRTVSMIAPTALLSEYILLGLYPIVTSEITLFVRYTVNPRKMVSDNDMPWPIPQKYVPVIKDGVLMKAWDYLKMPQRSQKAQGDFERGLENMKTDDARRVSSSVVIGGNRAKRGAFGWTYPRRVAT